MSAEPRDEPIARDVLAAPGWLVVIPSDATEEQTRSGLIVPTKGQTDLVRAVVRDSGDDLYEPGSVVYYPSGSDHRLLDVRLVPFSCVVAFEG